MVPDHSRDDGLDYNDQDIQSSLDNDGEGVSARSGQLQGRVNYGNSQAQNQRFDSSNGQGVNLAQSDRSGAAERGDNQYRNYMANMNTLLDEEVSNIDDIEDQS